MNKKLKFVLIVIAIIGGIELILRLYFGFCDAVLIREDPHYEYIAQANQDRFRFRNHIRYNSMSMRSEEIDSSAIIILGLGDSVINGGTQTDQDSLATTVISDALSEGSQKVQFLNISAGSWGPDNCFAYLKKHGNFGARSMVLFVSSHDAFDNMNFEKIVGVNESFPDEQYASSISEVMNRYVIPRLKSFAGIKNRKTDGLGINKKQKHSEFNPGFDSLLAYSMKYEIPLTIYLHADRQELHAGSYNEQGQKIIDFAVTNKVKLIPDLENKLSSFHFRDNIHLNASGQLNLANTVIKTLQIPGKE